MADGSGPGITRRVFVAGVLSAWALPLRAAGEAEAPAPSPPADATESPFWKEGALAPGVAPVLAAAPYAYVSPLRSDGTESECHGEVWFAWLDGEVVTTTAADRWKAQAIRRGLDRARLWFGNYGRWKRLTGRNEAFRRGPTLLARGRIVKRDASSLLERILAVYEEKYPEEMPRWRKRMRNELASGDRVIVRYRPVGA